MQKFGIQATIPQFKIVQNFFERCLSKALFPCFRTCCICFIMENTPAHTPFKFSNVLIGYNLAHVVMIYTCRQFLAM